MKTQIDQTEYFFQQEDMIAYINNRAEKWNLAQTKTALPYAIKMHDGQFRKGGDHIPYVNHPMVVACHALSLGIKEDDVIATALLHDVCEDCGVAPEELPVGEEVKRAVFCLTKWWEKGKQKVTDETEYYARIQTQPNALMVKVLDRCHNISTMTNGFSVEKMKSYIAETEEYILPLFDVGLDSYPQYKPMLLVVRYHMLAMLRTTRELLD